MVKLKQLGLTILSREGHVFSFRDTSRLKSIRTSGDRDHWCQRALLPTRWMRVFEKPLLNRLYVRNIGGKRDTNWDENWQMMKGGPYVPPATFSVTHIEFRDCIIFQNELDPVLSRCKELITFIYELSWPHGDRWSCEDIIDLHMSLGNHSRHAIQNVSIVCRWWNSKERTMTVPHLHFHGFEALTFLKISPVLLFGKEQHVWKTVDLEDDPTTNTILMYQV